MRRLVIIPFVILWYMAVGASAGNAHCDVVENDCRHDWLVIIDGNDTVTVSQFEKSFENNRIGIAESMSAHEYLDKFITYRLNVADARLQMIDTLPEFRLTVASHLMSLSVPYMPPQLVDGISGLDDDLYDRIVAAADSIYNARADIRDAVSEYSDYMLVEYAVEDYLDKSGIENQDSLNRFFEMTRNDYNWDAPRFKGYIICVAQGENQAEAKTIVERLGGDMKVAIPLLRKEYGRNVRISHVVMPAGVNEIVDYVAFGGRATENVNRWALCMAVDGRLINAPESAEDVHGLLTEEYRKMLIDRRDKSLRSGHNVKINQKALKKIESFGSTGFRTSSAQNN